MILTGDCLDVLRTLDDDSVDAIVTDPPYGLAFMGKRWDYDVPAVEVWAECLRVLKPGGHLLAFAGTRTQHRMACRIEDAGFEIRDLIAWVYGSGFPKSLNVSKAVDQAVGLSDAEAQFCAWMRDCSGLDADTVRRLTGSARFITGEVEVVNTATKDAPRYGRRAMVPTAAAWSNLRPHMATPPEWVEALVKDPPKPGVEHPGQWSRGAGEGTAGTNEWAGWGTALKPALEPITMARKPLAGTVAANVLAYGTGALNIDGCRVEAPEGVPLFSSRGEANGKTLGDGLNGSNRTGDVGAGRWPANLIHDGSDEVLAGFPESAGQQASVAGTEPSKTGDANCYGEFGRVPFSARNDSGSAARFFYCAKASRADRNDGCDALDERPLHWSSGDANPGSFQAEGTHKAARNHHPTVKPTDLMRYLCRLVTPPGGLVLDPFAGSGSTGRGALLEGFRFLGIEREPDYAAIAEARIAAVVAQLDREAAQHAIDTAQADLFAEVAE